ncbi:hypothetical protein ACWEP3_29800, partial [Streptomyces albidoflavus]
WRRPVPVREVRVPGDGAGVRGDVPDGVAAAPVAVGAGLFRNRSAALLGTVARLDQAVDEEAARRFAESAAGAYAEEFGAVPLGLVARCLLGPPYVDHILNLSGVIVRHFAPHTAMPEPFDRARMLARSDGYLYVEVFSDGLTVPVRPDGTVVRP